MIARLKGVVGELHGTIVTLDVNGVGYEILASLALAQKLEVGAKADVTVYTDVKEDSIRLFGFSDALEKQVFLLLLKVSGVGTKTALDVISGLECRKLLRAIGEGDTAALQAVRGVGKKTAERIVLELRDKVAELAFGEHPSAKAGVKRESFQDAIEALQALGFTRNDAETAVRAVEQRGILPRSADPGAIVKEALRFV